MRGSDQLGEVPDAPREWFSGRTEGPTPLAQVVGDRSCLTIGGIYPPVRPPGTKDIYGVDSRCFNLTFGPAPVAAIEWNMSDASVQLAYAQILDWMYRDTTRIEPALRTWLGPAPTITIVPNSESLVPGMVIVQTSTYTLVFISGTSSRQQLAAQALLASARQTNVGPFSTNTLWALSSDVINARLTTAGVDAGLPIILAGDSYGGVIATLLAARYQIAQPGRGVRLLTFGMPKPGDARVGTALAGVTRVHIVNDDDPVAGLPPTSDELAFLAFLVPAELRAQWEQYRPAGQALILGQDLTLSPGPAPGLTWSILSRIIAQILAGEPLDPFTGHHLGEYLRRLRLRAPIPPLYPVDAAMRAELVDGDVVAGVDLGEVQAGGDADVIVL